MYSCLFDCHVQYTGLTPYAGAVVGGPGLLVVVECALTCSKAAGIENIAEEYYEKTTQGKLNINCPFVTKVEMSLLNMYQ